MEWIKIEDRLPNQPMKCLVYDEGDNMFIAYYEHTLGCWSNYDEEYNFTGAVTHWMPLPEPPKE